MVNDYRIKQEIIPAITVNGSLIEKQYTGFVINGEVLKVRVENIASPGSFWVAQSGTDLEIFRQNNLTSGLSTFEVYLGEFGVDNSNSTGSPSMYFSPVVNEELYFEGSGFTSGTSTSFGPVTVYYR